MPRVIMEIPNQHFYFLAGPGCFDDHNICLDFAEERTGTIFLVTCIVEGDEDAVVPFGVPDGETEGKIAFWLPIKAFRDLWEKMIKEKQKCIKED